jgi:hypothetical protein
MNHKRCSKFICYRKRKDVYTKILDGLENLERTTCDTCYVGNLTPYIFLKKYKFLDNWYFDEGGWNQDGEIHEKIQKKFIELSEHELINEARR